MNDNELLTTVGPGTPMGELMRQYWIPALMSSELQRDGPPVRLKLLGEELIAFRTTSGKVGILDHHCPHRRTSLFFGRNEENGIRCVFHGWKFDADGNCLDQPNVPPHLGSAYRVKAKAYRTTEHIGIVWVYMGKRVEPPPLPHFPAFDVPQDRLSVWCEQRECNYLQPIEGELDTSHAGFLHMGQADRAAHANNTYGVSLDVENRAVEYKVIDTDVGIMAGGYRPADDQNTYWRIGNLLLPFWTQPPPCAFGSEAVARAWVPMDDTHTMLFGISTDTYVMAMGPRAIRPTSIPGMSFDYEFLPNTSDWYGRWRMARNLGNDYLINRTVQRATSYSGIEGLDAQDSMVQETMGAIADRSQEHLVPSDLAVARIRRRLLEAVKALRDTGTPPPGVDQPEAYGRWCGFLIAPKFKELMEVYDEAVAGREGVAPVTHA
jgi:phenylpropionate dioxygenase-like ring-hydroxylating dioxygenase large terminal subunit